MGLALILAALSRQRGDHSGVSVAAAVGNLAGISPLRRLRRTIASCVSGFWDRNRFTALVHPPLAESPPPTSDAAKNQDRPTAEIPANQAPVEVPPPPRAAMRKRQSLPTRDHQPPRHRNRISGSTPRSPQPHTNKIRGLLHCPHTRIRTFDLGQPRSRIRCAF